MNIEVIGLKTIHKGGLKGSASIQLDKKIIINEIKILETSNGNRVSMPTIMWVDNGQKFRKPAIEVPDQLRSEIQKNVLEVYNARTSN